MLEQGQQVSPAELQGLMLGRCCAGASFDTGDCIRDAGILFDGEIPSSLHQSLDGLQEMLKTELTAEDSLAVTLLLPTDETALKERLAALAQWCQGFLSGFGNQIGNSKLSDEVREILQDYVAISQLDLHAENEPDDESSEASYMELTEYLRITPVLLFAEFGTRPQKQEKPEQPAVH